MTSLAGRPGGWGCWTFRPAPPNSPSPQTERRPRYSRCYQHAVITYTLPARRWRSEFGQTPPGCSGLALSCRAVSAVVGLGQRSLGQNPTAYERRLAADLDHLGMQVTPQNVLQIRNIVLGAAQRLDDALYRLGRNIRVGPPGGDPISQPAADELNRRSQALLAEYRVQINAYHNAGQYLGQIARDYGYTEQSITDSFNKFRTANQGSWEQRLEQGSAVAKLPRLIRDVVDPPSSSRPPPSSWQDLLKGGVE
jgi:hypothetical protein